MTVLLTGPNGFVGQHLKKRLESDGHHVIPCGRGFVPSTVPDAIINCAAELTDESKMFESNVVLTHDLLEFARINHVSRFIQVGSSSEYGKTNAPRREDSVCVPSNIYEATKLAATALCQGYASRYSLDVVVARPFSLYGPNDKPRKLIPTLYRSFLDHAQITVRPGGHDWLYIDDFVDGLISLLHAPREVTQGQIFNFGTGVSSTNRQTVEALEAALGSKLNIIYADGRHHAHDVDNWVADSSKAREQLGWVPRYDLANGMKAFVMAEWFGPNGDKG